MAPPNLTALTAADLGTLPASVTLDVTTAPGGQNEVWYKYTAVADEIQIGVLAFAATGHNYRPEILVYLGPAAAPVPYTSGGDSFQIDGTQQGISIPVTAGVTYYFQILNAGSVPPGTNLVLTAQTAPVLNVPLGSIIVPDDVDGYNAVALNPSTGAVLRYFALLANGDWGHITAAGIMAFDHPAPTYLSLYDNQLHLIRTGYGTAEEVAQITTDLSHTFYLAHGASYAVAKTISTMSDAGVVGGTTWTLPADSINGARNFAMGVSRDNTILYYAAARVNGAAVHRYDLVNAIALTDLAAGVAGTHLLQDILVLSDNTILVGYAKGTATKTYFVRHYSAAGAILATYDDGTEPQNNRLTLAADDPLSFWEWSYPATNASGQGATGLFRNIRISDGAILASWTDDMFTNGVDQVQYDPARNGGFTVTPQVFGPPFSCGFLQLRAAIAPPGPPPGTIDVVKVNRVHDATAFPFVATNLTPAAFSLADGETQSFTGLTPGSGYGIAETVPDHWTVAYEVSNGSAIDNLTVGDGETVTVTVTNDTTLSPDERAGRYTSDPIRRLRQSPHLTHEGVMLFYGAFEVALETGRGLTRGQGVDPQIMLQWSDDGGHTWSNDHWVSAGKKGTYGTRARWLMLGRGRNRVFRIVMTDPVPWHLTDAFVDVTAGTG